MGPEQHGADDEDEVEIVYAYARTDPDDPSSMGPKTKVVPADWYEAYQRADAVFQQVKDDWIRKPGVHGVGVGGDRSDRVVVTIDFKRAEVREQFPDAIEGVPVEIRFTDPDKDEPL